jgi:hypothetical protein
MTLTPVRLTKCEVIEAAVVGIERDLRAKGEGMAPLITGSNTFLGNITGAVGELTVSKALDVFWTPNTTGNDHATGDVGKFQVRATNRRPPGLTIRARDIDDAPYVLVIGQPPCPAIAGWLYAGAGKREEWRDRRYGDGWYVPVEALHDWDTRPW